MTRRTRLPGIPRCANACGRLSDPSCETLAAKMLCRDCYRDTDEHRLRGVPMREWPAKWQKKFKPMPMGVKR